jgi:hypothetical protein
MVHTRSFLLALLASVAAPLATTACSNQTGDEQGIEVTGTVSAALSTTGSDGATYQFPPNSYLIVKSTATWDYFLIDDASAIFTQSLPVGTYEIGLYFDGNASPTLLRTEGSETTTVSADWTDPDPLSFEILQDTTTPIVLHFHVEGLGDLTFDTGNLQVTFDVIQDITTQPDLFKESGDITFVQEEYADPGAQYATELDVDTSAPTAQSLWVQSESDWAQVGANSVCKDVSLAALGYGSPGLGNRYGQLADADYGTLCIYDYGEGYPYDYAYFSIFANGPAPVAQQSYLPDPAYNFSLYFSTDIPDVYDGETLEQTALEQPVTGNGFVQHYVYTNDYSTLLTNVYGAGPVTIQLSP